MKTRFYLMILIIAMANQAYPQCSYDTLGVKNLVDSLSINFPSICKKEVIGYSVLGREITALKISDNVIIDENEPEVLLVGCIHGSEQPGCWMICNLAREFCLQYNTNSQIQNLVNNREIWIVPIVNPDGYVGEPGWGPTKPNANHVDLNRDAGYMWTGYVGTSPGPFSQPESKVIRDFILSRNLNIMIDYHSGLQGIIYPWAYRSEVCPDYNELSYLASAYRTQSGYPAGDFQVTQAYDLYQTNGSLIEFAYGALGINAFCVELFNGFSGNGCIGLQYNQASMLMMIEKAGFGIQGTVTDANTGQPVAARISVQGKMPVYNSPSIGDYHKFLNAGTYTITVSANGYDSQTFNNVVVINGTPTALDAQLIQNSTNQSALKIIIAKNFPDNEVAADPALTWNTQGMPDGQYYPLGDTGYVVLDIGSTIVNVSGNDITVTGSASGAGNGYELYCSITPDGPWIFLGNETSTHSFEMGNLANIRYVKVIDNGSGPGNLTGAGFHLDAVTVAATTVGIYDPISETSDIRIYPNPSHGLINITTTNPADTGSAFRITDISGKCVYNVKLQFAYGTNEKLDLSHLDKGIYFIQILSKINTETIKIVLQ